MTCRHSQEAYMSFVDFAQLKGAVTLEQAVAYLGLKLAKSNNQYRGSCPVHGGGARGLAVTPSKGFYCFGSKTGGDVIGLVSHIKEIPAKEAADWLAQQARFTTREEKQPDIAPVATTALKPLDYLQYTEQIAALGVTEETCKEFGAGYAPKGIMRGKFAIPVYDRKGTLLAYAGRALDSPHLHFPNNFDPASVIFGCHRVKEGELHLVRDPLEVLAAYQAGMENVVCFLTEGIGPQQFEQLSGLMDEAKCERVFF
jgi:hypothetical protein